MLGRDHSQGNRQSGNIVSANVSKRIALEESSYRNTIHMTRVCAKGRGQAHNNTEHITDGPP
jgi:hypothetical protein